MDCARSIVLVTAAIACLCQAGAAVHAEEASPSRAVLKPAKERGSHPRGAAKESAPAGTSVNARAFSGCVAGWYSKTRMSKDEWRNACQRAFADKGMTFERQLSLCMEGWDPATHMTKREWQIVCRRSLQR